MNHAVWFLLVGVLMLSRGLTSRRVQRLPVTPAILYLGAGFIVGPSVLGWFVFDPVQEAHLLELLTEVALLISLFSAGVKVPVPVTWARWRPAVRLAGVSMVLTIALVATFAYAVLALPPGASILLAAMLAPTDPVLATDVQSRHPGDNDQLRFTLTCEAGLNDGTAFPFVVLGLGLLGAEGFIAPLWQWAVLDLVWATLGAIGIGVLGGRITARQVWRYRRLGAEHQVLDDLVGLGLIAIVYGLGMLLHTWGFLAVFFAAVSLRQEELRLARAAGIAAHQLNDDVAEPARPEPNVQLPAIVSSEALLFKEHLERLSELLLVLLLGGMLTLDHWNWRTVGLAVFLFAVARSLGAAVGLIGTDTSPRIRAMAGWFGVRGIGSLYYLAFAIRHGLPPELARDMVQLTLVAVTGSIVVHGTSVKPLLARLWSRQG